MAASEIPLAVGKMQMRKCDTSPAIRLALAGVARRWQHLAIAGSSAAAAADNQRRHRHTGSYAQTYPSDTQRQLRNARAYDRGGYFEQDSNAHPVGSRGWWELKERER